MSKTTTVECFLGYEDIDPDDPMVWQATSCWSRSGRLRAGGARGGTDRIEFRRHEVWVCADHLQQWRRGVLGQQTFVIEGSCTEATSAGLYRRYE
jgi:hypothetical protein